VELTPSVRWWPSAVYQTSTVELRRDGVRLLVDPGIAPWEIEEVRDAARTVTSLDRPVGDEGETAFGELLPSEQAEPEEEVQLNLQQEQLRRAVAQLPDREREVVKLRYGINGDEPTPLRETGRRLGLSPERVRQIESKALEQLAMTRELEALNEAA
jgi:RNA polymerase primary sigma factor